MGEAEHTSSAVQVGEVQNISCAADWVAGRAETELALHNSGSGESDGCESNNGGDGELHIDDCGVFLKEEEVLSDEVFVEKVVEAGECCWMMFKL